MPGDDKKEMKLPTIAEIDRDIKNTEAKISSKIDYIYKIKNGPDNKDKVNDENHIREYIKEAEKKIQNLYSVKNELIKAAVQIDASNEYTAIEKKIANAQIKSIEQTTDALILDANEAKAYELIKKTGILKDLAGFQAKLASGDSEAKWRIS